MAHSIIHLYVHFNNWSYEPPIEMGIVSEVSSRLPLALSKI